MEYYRSKVRPIPGTDYKEVHYIAEKIYRSFKARTKRRPYIRSAYFKKDKIFLDFFWHHLHQKNWRDRVRRLKYYPPALDLVRHSRLLPISKKNPNRPTEILHRFGGITSTNQKFYVQIKENKRTKQKALLSIFPE